MPHIADVKWNNHCGPVASGTVTVTSFASSTTTTPITVPITKDGVYKIYLAAYVKTQQAATGTTSGYIIPKIVYTSLAGTTVTIDAGTSLNGRKIWIKDKSTPETTYPYYPIWDTDAKEINKQKTYGMSNMFFISNANGVVPGAAGTPIAGGFCPTITCKAGTDVTVTLTTDANVTNNGACNLVLFYDVTAV